MSLGLLIVIHFLLGVQFWCQLNQIQSYFPKFCDVYFYFLPDHHSHENWVMFYLIFSCQRNFYSVKFKCLNWYQEYMQWWVLNKHIDDNIELKNEALYSYILILKYRGIYMYLCVCFCVFMYLQHFKINALLKSKCAF